jgi:hypothetical protein
MYLYIEFCMKTMIQVLIKKEEIKMKTQESELKEVKAQGIVMIAFYVLVMSGILIITGGNSQEAAFRLKNSEAPGNDEKSLAGMVFASSPAAVESESFLFNLYEALEPIEDPAITVSDLMDIHFPSAIMEDIGRDYTEDTFLKSMLEEKNREVTAEYELFWNLKDCLKEESEKPLEVENWMFDDAFWSHGSR